MEDYGYVLDYLPYGKSSDKQRIPAAYVIGEQQFTLLEITPKKNVELKIEERIFVGKGDRPKVDKIRRRIDSEELSSASREMLPNVVKTIVKAREQFFISMFNNAKALNIRMHQLELLPGIGKKHMEDFLDERTKKKFESFDDIRTRVSLFPDPLNVVTNRIVQELTEKNSRYYLFVRPYVKQDF